MQGLARLAAAIGHRRSDWPTLTLHSTTAKIIWRVLSTPPQDAAGLNMLYTFYYVDWRHDSVPPPRYAIVILHSEEEEEEESAMI